MAFERVCKRQRFRFVGSGLFRPNCFVVFEALPSSDSTWKQHAWIACIIFKVNTDIPRTIEATDFAITKADGRRR